MKIKIFSVAICFVLIASLLTGCGGFTPLTGGPSIDDAVTSNGGMVVRKGNFLYFANGFLDSKELVEGDNEYNEEENSAIYRAELDQNGNLMVDEEGNLINIELLIPKIVGFENGGFYIFDDYIYYATPTILKDNTGAVRFDLVDFYRAKLDGSQVTKLYATNDYSANAKFSFYKIENIVYLAVFDGTSLISVKINNKIGSPVTMVKEAQSVVLPKITDYNANNNTNINAEVYYTRALNESDGTVIELGNTLAKMTIGSTVEQVLVQDNIWTYDLKEYKNNSLYYTKRSSNSLNAKNYYRNVAGNFIDNEETQLTGTSYQNVSALDFENNNQQGVVASNGSQLILITDVLSTDGIEVLVNEKVTILFNRGDYVYYSYGDNNTIARVNFKTKVIEDVSNPEDEIKVDENLKIDYDNDYIYFFKKHTNEKGDSYYLERVNVISSSFETEFIGVLEADDLPDVEEVA